MQLITKKTTLDEFISNNRWLIKDPVTNLVCQVFLKDTLSGMAKFMFAVQAHTSGVPCKYLRFNSGCNSIIVDRAGVLLTALKKGNFILDY